MSHSTLTRSIRLSLTALLLIMVLVARTVSAATTEYTIPVTYDQTSARSMLSMVNEFRTGSDAWYYNSDGSVHNCTGLSEYTYDYNLEQIAMQRACEVAIRFEHSRPDGSSCFTCTYNGTRSYGENIAAGNSTASATFVQWQENNDDYSGQGHRRAMLSSSYTSIGIGHVVYRGRHYWVQEFGYTNSGAAQTPAIDSEVNKTIPVNTDFLSLNCRSSSSSATVYMDQDSILLPTISANIKVEYGWGTDGIALDPSEYTLNWNISDTTIATLSGTDIIPVSPGTTTAIATVTYGNMTQDITVNITVRQRPISSATISSIATQTYTGSAIEPELNITYNGRTLAQGTDYTVTYSNNINSGYASASITGIGNYTGTVNKSFYINRRSIEETTVTGLDAQTYTGSAITPPITLSYGESQLTANTDYQIYSTSFTNAGTYNITIYGSGNFNGSKTVSFTVNPRPITDATVAPIADRIYSASPQTPSPVLTIGSTTLSISNYTLAYTDNTNAGTATITITGRGNYSGTTTATFTIGQRDINTVTFYSIGSYPYTGAPVTPDLSLRYGTGLIAGTDYSAVYSNNVNAGTASVTVTGIGNFTGERSSTFSITRKSLTDVSIASIPDQTYTGAAITPDLTVTLGDATLMPGTDYTAYYYNNVNAGTATVTISGIGNYTGNKSATFVIYAPDPGPTPDPGPVTPDPVTPDPVTPDPVLPDDPPAPEGTVNMYRLYNINSGEHFYTSNAGERNTLITLGWRYEGIGWTAPSYSNTPVYRLYNRYGGEHHYTMSAGERDALVNAGWDYEGIGWYSDDNQTVPLYRQYNPNAFSNNHNYTTSLGENNFLVSIGWRAEGIGWYGV